MIAVTRTLLGAALGAAAMYWLDPESGRRRRAVARDQLGSVAGDLSGAVGASRRGLSNRMRGLGARARSSFKSSSSFRSDDSGDEQLAERVRSVLEHVVSHPGAIDVSVEQDRVVLSGAALKSEHPEILRTVQSVSGVREVSDQLEVYDSPEGIPALQGGRERRARRSGLMQENWSPVMRVVMGVAGGALIVHALRRGGLLGVVEMAGGGALAARSTTNKPLRRMLGMGGGRAIDVRKTIHVNAPVEQVFETLSHYENFPSFMRNIREVRTIGDRRSHWVVAGPAGASVEWDAETTEYVPNELLAWRTVPGSTVEHSGMIRLEPVDGGTRLHYQMSYSPPAGAVGHAFASLFGADPKSELDEDLQRMKTFIETGAPPRDASRPRATPPGQQSSREIH